MACISLNDRFQMWIASLDDIIQKEKLVRFEDKIELNCTV